MKRRGRVLRVGYGFLAAAVLCGALSGSVGAELNPPVPQLVFRELKITGDEFIVLENTGTAATPTLDHYWLGYTGDDQAAPVPTQQLPAGLVLQPGQTLLLSYGTAQTCDAVAVAKLSSSLSDTKGVLSLWQASPTSFSLLPGTVRWLNKPSDTYDSDGKTPVPLAFNTKDDASVTDAVWYKDPADPNAAWRLGDFQAACTLTFTAGSSDSGSSAPVSIVWPQNDTDPPAIIESLATSSKTASGPYLPAADLGLKPPQLTELLPNPLGTGTDKTDEFIELYNPNSRTFDLSGFKLQTGLTTKHTYTFPAGTTLAPKKFTAFYSADTGLSLSNTTGQADLQDPFGTVIAKTGVYGSAKDGQAWALANGTWYWTLKPTPNAANIVNQTSGSIRTVSDKQASAAIKGASTTASPLQGTAQTAASDTPAPAPVHPGVLAAVAALAVGYGVYEYRHDLANRIHQFREHRAARRKARS